MYSGMDTTGLNRICPEINYLKDEKLKELQRKYNIFTILLNNRRKVKNIKDRMTHKEIEGISQISRRT
jgi:hypothetical protein